MPIFLPDSRRPNEESWMNEQVSKLKMKKATALQACMQSKPKEPGGETGVQHPGTW